MPTTPDRPDGRPAGSEDPFEVAEAAHLAARETVPGRTRPAPARPYGVDRDTARATERVDLANHETRRIDVRPGAGTPRPSSCPASAARRTAPAGRPLLVAAGFATLWAALLSYLPVAAVIGLARTLEGAGGLGGAPRTPGWPAGCSGTAYRWAPRSARWRSRRCCSPCWPCWRLNRAGLHVTRAIGARRSGSPRDALLVAGHDRSLVRGARRRWPRSSSTGPAPRSRPSGPRCTFFVLGVAGGARRLAAQHRRAGRAGPAHPAGAAARPAHRRGGRAADPGRGRRVRRAVGRDRRRSRRPT